VIRSWQNCGKKLKWLVSLVSNVPINGIGWVNEFDLTAGSNAVYCRLFLPNLSHFSVTVLTEEWIEGMVSFCQVPLDFFCYI